MYYSFIIFMSVIYLSREIMGILLFVLWYFSVCISISLFLAVFQLTNHLSVNLPVYFSLQYCHNLLSKTHCSQMHY